ncbi:hypothetical protein [Xanthomonas sp. 3058]|uniref:hypothetical protein n=1 Tax=Xanthomonas sp. 3058 TaxID=3035314 RepID=UPI00161F0021|nr:hypothetical protein [Xanthomonas sp. 3058]MBB5865323.1 hypothetical protein [Xanthomonas sp. 3058]
MAPDIWWTSRRTKTGDAGAQTALLAKYLWHRDMTEATTCYCMPEDGAAMQQASCATQLD